MSEQRIDIGHGHSIAYFQYPDGKQRGLTLYHPAPSGAECACSVLWDRQGANHSAVSLEPLTISPSVICLVCGDHGFIREGKWVPA